MAECMHRRVLPAVRKCGEPIAELSASSPLEGGYRVSQTLMVFMPLSASARVLKATGPT